MAKVRTQVSAKKDMVVVKHRCQTAEFTVEEADAIVRDILRAREDAVQYQPTTVELTTKITDLMSHIASDWSDGKPKRSKKKRRSKKAPDPPPSQDELDLRVYNFLYRQRENLYTLGSYLEWLIDFVDGKGNRLNSLLTKELKTAEKKKLDDYNHAIKLLNFFNLKFPDMADEYLYDSYPIERYESLCSALDEFIDEFADDFWTSTSLNKREKQWLEKQLEPYVER